MQKATEVAGAGNVTDEVTVKAKGPAKGSKLGSKNRAELWQAKIRLYSESSEIGCTSSTVWRR